MIDDVWNGWESHGIFFGPLPCTLHVLADIILVEPEKDSDHQIKENIKTNLAISGTSGSSGFGSQRSEQIESSTWGPWAKFQSKTNYFKEGNLTVRRVNICQICQNILNLGYCKRRRPLGPQYVQADSSIAESYHYEIWEGGLLRIYLLMFGW